MFPLCVLLAAAQQVPAPAEFHTRFPVSVDGVPIDVDLGHAAPLMTDWDGDGLVDLLVGQFGDGRLAIYRNTGKRGEPVFKGPEWFNAGGTRGKIPAG